MPARARFRLATPDDAWGIAEVQVAGWLHAYRGIVPDAQLDALTVEGSAGRRRDGMARAADRGISNHVLEADGRIVAWAASGPWRAAAGDAPSWEGSELYALYIEPTRIGTGLGRQLWLAVRASLRARGTRRVRLWTFVANARARRFYERAGFREDPDVPREEFEETGAMKLCYVLDLPATEDVGEEE